MEFYLRLYKQKEASRGKERSSYTFTGENTAVTV